MRDYFVCGGALLHPGLLHGRNAQGYYYEKGKRAKGNTLALVVVCIGVIAVWLHSLRSVGRLIMPQALIFQPRAAHMQPPRTRQERKISNSVMSLKESELVA